VDLGFHDKGAHADRLGGGFRVPEVKGHMPLGDSDSVTGQDLFALVLVDVHGLLPSSAAFQDKKMDGKEIAVPGRRQKSKA
jgi:hypothetical protein